MPGHVHAAVHLVAARADGGLYYPCAHCLLSIALVLPPEANGGYQ